MILLRLFRQENPSAQIDSRVLGEGELKIGRDPGVGWAIDDPDRMLSRAHCVISNRGGKLVVRDTSANGAFVGERLARAEPEQSLPLALGDTVRLGHFLIQVEQSADSAQATGASPFGAPGAGPVARDASPFAPPPGLDPIDTGDGRRRHDPFASALPPDPLAPSRRTGRAAFGEDGDGDVWERRPEPRAGEWNAPSTATRQAGHERLIGSDRAWVEPPPLQPPEMGFGFDAPFNRPLLKAPEPGADDVRIPSDWDARADSETPGITTEAPAQAAAAAPIPASALAAPAIPAPAIAAPAIPAPTIPAPAIPAPTAPAPTIPLAPVSVFGTPVPGGPVAADSAATSAPAAAADAAALLQAFCAGARLDPRALAGDDPIEVMRRLGGVYQQMVLGLGDLLGERTSVKNEFRMTRTTMGADGNNPFKWAPPQRVALELLRDGGDGFMVGPAAVKASFEDLKKHLLCMLAGVRATLAVTLDALSPATVEQELSSRNYLIKAQRDAAAWGEFTRLYAHFRQQADDNADSAVNRAFRTAYERQLQELDGVDGRR